MTTFRWSCRPQWSRGLPKLTRPMVPFLLGMEVDELSRLIVHDFTAVQLLEGRFCLLRG